MPKLKLYVFVSDSKIRVTEQQKAFVDLYRAKRGDSISQAVRDMIDHCMECPFFMPNGSTNESISREVER